MLSPGVMNSVLLDEGFGKGDHSHSVVLTFRVMDSLGGWGGGGAVILSVSFLSGREGG